jgi:hypothetical protein
MEQKKVTTWARKLASVLSEEKVNGIGRSTRFFRRERIVTAHRMAMTLLSMFASNRVETLADIQRGFNALFECEMAYKPFHNQLSKREFAEFMRRICLTLLDGLVVRVLGSRPEGPFSEFKKVVIQDGSSFAVKDTLREVFPGRFKTVKPAAVELHATFDLLNESLLSVTLTPDTTAERTALPAPESLAGCLLLADRGYFSRAYFYELQKAGASFVVRAKTDIKPLIIEAISARGKRIRGLSEKLLDESLLPKKGATDLRVSWRLRGGKVLECRLIATWNPRTNEFQYLVTNLPQASYTPAQVSTAYRLRWQVELLFKEWKSYANLHAFNTGKASIVEGLIWAAIGAAALKRFLAQATQRIAQVETSTRKTAMCAVHVLANLFQALTDGRFSNIERAFQKAIDYLSKNAIRAHPQRDRKQGRLQGGLEPVGVGC